MKKIFIFLGTLFFVNLIIPLVVEAEDFIDTIFTQDQHKSGKQKGPTVITADTMDMDIKNNLITLVGTVAVDDPENRLTSDKMIVYLKDTKQGGTKKDLKAIVALGNVIMTRKAITQDDKKMGKREAHAGRADYDAVAGIIIMTENPILYQGESYMKGNRITLWKNSERMKVEGDQSAGNASRIVINQNTDTGAAPNAEKTDFKLGI